MSSVIIWKGQVLAAVICWLAVRSPAALVVHEKMMLVSKDGLSNFLSCIYCSRYVTFLSIGADRIKTVFHIQYIICKGLLSRKFGGSWHLGAPGLSPSLLYSCYATACAHYPVNWSDVIHVSQSTLWFFVTLIASTRLSYFPAEVPEVF
jgi:hypothetical protein